MFTGSDMGPITVGGCVNDPFIEIILEALSNRISKTFARGGKSLFGVSKIR